MTNVLVVPSDDVICGHIFPYLSVIDLQSLDTAYTNKNLRPHLRRLWTLYNYDNIDEKIYVDNVTWLAGLGVKMVSVCVWWHSEIHTLAGLSASLRELSIEAQFSNGVLFELAQRCPQIEMLRLDFGLFSDEGLIAVAQNCHQLHTISWGSGHTTDAAIKALCDNCPHLRRFHFKYLTDASLVSIASTYPHLQSISTIEASIFGDAITDTGLLAIADKCHMLKSVNFRCCPNVTSAGFAALWAANPNLIEVDITLNEVILDLDIMMLSQCCPQLQCCVLNCCNSITDAAIIALAEHCEQLTALNISNCENMSDYSLIALGQHCHGLTSIDISYISNISDVGVSALAAGCPLLQDFTARQTNITDAAVIAVAEYCPQLTLLNINQCDSISDDALIALGQHCHGLTSIDVSSIEKIFDVGVSAVASGCPLLREFTGSYTKITDAGMITLAGGCRGLRTVVIVSCKSIGFGAISAIAANCPLISELDLFGCESVDDACMHALAKHCRNLATLDVRYTCVSEDVRYLNYAFDILVSC